jgi:hypothetical protein
LERAGNGLFRLFRQGSDVFFVSHGPKPKIGANLYLSVGESLFLSRKRRYSPKPMSFEVIVLMSASVRNCPFEKAPKAASQPPLAPITAVKNRADPYWFGVSIRVSVPASARYIRFRGLDNSGV